MSRHQGLSCPARGSWRGGCIAPPDVPPAQLSWEGWAPACHGNEKQLSWAGVRLPASESVWVGARPTPMHTSARWDPQPSPPGQHPALLGPPLPLPAQPLWVPSKGLQAPETPQTPQGDQKPGLPPPPRAPSPHTHPADEDDAGLPGAGVQDAAQAVHDAAAGELGGQLVRAPGCKAGSVGGRPAGQGCWGSCPPSGQQGGDGAGG